MSFANIESSLEKLFDLVLLKIPSIAVGFAILIIGRFVIKYVLKFVENRFIKRDIDVTIRSFVKSLMSFAMYGLLILTVANTMGIETTSFIAALSAFGLAVGMALQGSLSNFAGGVLILVFRPFDVGDYISSANGSSGSVERIDLLYTTIIDDDGIRVFSPNGTLANSVIKNYSKITARRMQFTFIISYETNIKQARESILSVLNADKRILETPKKEVIVGDLKETGVSLVVRAWANREVYWATKNEIGEEIKNVLDGANLVFPSNIVKIIDETPKSNEAEKTQA